MRQDAFVFWALWTVASAIGTRKSQALSALKGKTIRVTYTATEYPYIFRDGESGEWTGVLTDLLEELRKETGFVLSVTELSADSRAVAGSNNNSICPRDVHLNRTDLCVGNTWVTTPRLGYARVSPTFWQDKIKLVVRLTDGGLRNAVLQPFKPFAAWLWLCVAFVIVAYAACTWYIEHEKNSRDFPDRGVLSSTTTSLYLALFGFVWSDPPSRPVTAEGRILAVGFGFFLVLVLLSYTASLASVLVGRNLRPEFADLPSAIDAGATICMHGSLMPRVEKIFPELPATALFIPKWAEGYKMMDGGPCDGLLVEVNFHAGHVREMSERERDKALLDDLVVGINCGWFMADWLANPLSYFMTELMENGVLDDLFRRHSPKMISSSDGLDEEVEGLRAEDVGGVLFIMVAFFAVGAAAHCFRRCRRRSSRAPKRSSRSSAGSESGAIDCANSGDLDDPAFRLVKAFREEPGLEQMPFVKSILIIGQAQLEARGQLLRELSRFKAPRSTLTQSVQSELVPLGPWTEYAQRSTWTV